MGAKREAESLMSNRIFTVSYLFPTKYLLIKGEIITLQWIKLADTTLINDQQRHHQHRNKWLSVRPARVP